MEKEYTGSLTLGAITPTYDLESEPMNIKDISGLTEEQIHNATKLFTGTIQQVPPAHSAVKKDGKPVYLMARKGIELELEPRTITVQSFAIEKIELPVINFRVVCSTGTYIRSLANDFGKQLGTGAYLSSLRRTRIGEFFAEDAQQIQDLTTQIKQDALSERQADA
jgi:tRNA pseudouridine55 synthase